MNEESCPVGKLACIGTLIADSVGITIQSCDRASPAIRRLRDEPDSGLIEGFWPRIEPAPLSPIDGKGILSAISEA